MPGANVQVIRGGTTASVTVDENGRFSFVLNTKKTTGYPYTVRSSYPGYRRAEVSGRIRRTNAEDAAKAARAIDYQELLAAPEQYADTLVSYTGTVRALAYEAGTPKALLEADDGNRYLLYCDNLIALEQGRELSLIGLINGTADALGGGEPCPVISLQTILDEPQKDGE